MKFSNKLSLSILITGMIVLITVSYTIYKISYNSIIKSQSLYSKSIADEISDDIDQLLYEKVKTTLTLANTPIIKKALETSNLSYSHLSDEKRKQSIKLLNEKWKSTKDPADNFILKFTDNKVSHFLKNQQALLKGEYGEIFLTNRFGALVASTAKLSTFAHGHKYWWLGSYDNGEGSVFFDDRGYDDSVGGYVLGLVVPIRKGTEIIGILKCNLNILGSISELISGAEDKLIGKFKLTRSGGMVVFEEGFEPLSTQIHDSIFEGLKRKNKESFIIDDSGKKYLVGFSEIKLTQGEKGYGFGGTFASIDHKKGNTGESWYVICYRQMNVVLAPTTKSIKSIVLMGFVMLVILALVSYLFGRKIAKPLAILDKATENIGKGNFGYRIDAGANNEFGNLARSFNSMADELQQTTTSVGLLENEIKHRKKIEKSLRESETVLQAAMDQSQAGIAIADAPDGKLRYVNNSGLGIRGKTKEEIVDGIGIEQYVAGWQILHFDGTPYKDDEVPLARAIMYGEVCSKEFIIRRPDEEDRIVLANAAPIFNDKGEVFAGIVVFLDVTDRKQVEEELRESEEKYRSMMESMKDPIYICSQDYRVEYMNPSMIQRTGRDATGEKCFKVLHDLKEKCPWCMHDKAQQGECFESEIVSPKDNRSYHISSSPIVRGDGAISKMTVFRDTTDLKTLETQLQQAQKMEAIGTLAGGIAHDFNNILGGIIGYAELAKMKAPEDSNVIAYLDKMIKSSDRATDLIKQILTLSRQRKQKQRPVQVRYIVNEALELLRATLPTTIEIREDLAKDTGIVNADPTQMHQVIMNLATNAGYAMQEDGGVLEITLANVELDDLSAEKHLDLAAGSYLRLTVSDTGHGMTSEIRERIFDPYFTTKDTGEGTGLGLSVAHGIVKTHGGTITVYSEPGKGTTFHVYLPLILEEEREEKESEEPLPTGSEIVLFIDDEEVLVEIGSQILEQLGYEVVTKQSSVQALELFRAEPDRFDLVITDMTMPHMTGDKLAQELMKIRPKIPIILCTGHSGLVSEEKAEEIGIKAFVMKPLVMRNLAEAVRKALDEK